MHMHSERIQILITREQRRKLESEAARRGASVASLVREAVDARFETVDRAARLRAIGEIRTMGGGRFLNPDELNRVFSSERDEALDDAGG